MVIDAGTMNKGQPMHVIARYMNVINGMLNMSILFKKKLTIIYLPALNCSCPSVEFDTVIVDLVNCYDVVSMFVMQNGLFSEADSLET